MDRADKDQGARVQILVIHVQNCWANFSFHAVLVHRIIWSEKMQYVQTCKKSPPHSPGERKIILKRIPTPGGVNYIVN